MDPIEAYLDIRRQAAVAEAQMTRAAQQIGLTPAQAASLVLLDRAGPQPLSYFGRALGITVSSTTYVADGLERAGYAERRYHLTDRRIHELVITDQGREAAAAFLAALHSTAQQKDGSDTRPAMLD